MPIVTLSNIEKTFGDRVLFHGLNLVLDRGERVGLIGVNGAGKTSLFRAITGELTPDAGTVAVARSAKVGYLTQDPSFDPANTVMDEAELAFADLHRLAHDLRDAEHAMADAAGEALDRLLARYQALQHDFDLAGGYAWQHRLEATLLGVGLDRAVWEQPVTTLSGGQRSRLALAKVLIADPDVLLLDEPTNHLDLVAIEWLEDYLLSFKGAALVVSHDRFLLDRLATRIAWLTQAAVRSYPGNYSAFVAQRELQELTQERQHERQQADIEKQKEFIRRFGAGQRSKEAKGREKRLNRLLASDDVVAAVQRDRQVRINLQTDRRAGDQVLQVRDLRKAYDGRVLWDAVRFDVTRGERVGIIGPNGSGKTTLLRCLLGSADADAGAVKWGANLNIGYYDQRLDDFDPDLTVMQTLAEGRDGQVKEQQLRDLLGAMLFRGDDIYKPAGALSGGERARVRFCQLVLDRPNVLVFDEPTNHLDIASAGALERMLREFTGTILCVSHDRYFLNAVVNRLLVLQPPGLADFGGNYSAWAQRQKELADEAAERSARGAASKPAPPKPAPAPKRPDPKRERDNPYARPFGRLTVEELERQIAETEEALGACHATLGDPARMRDAALAKRARDELDAASRKLEQLEAEYYAREP